MRYPTTVFLVACVLAAFVYASILRAAEPILRARMVENFHAKALEQLNKLPYLTHAQRNDIGLEIKRTTFKDLMNPDWAKEFTDKLILPPEHREAIHLRLTELHESFYEEAKEEKEEKDDKDEKKDFEKRLLEKLKGTLTVTFVRKTDLEEQIDVTLEGRCIAGEGKGSGSFEGSAEVKEGERSVTVVFRGLEPGSWQVAAHAPLLSAWDIEYCGVPGSVELSASRSR